MIKFKTVDKSVKGYRYSFTYYLKNGKTKTPKPAILGRKEIKGKKIYFSKKKLRRLKCKKCSVKVMAYAKVRHKTYKSEWSKTVTVKCK